MNKVRALVAGFLFLCSLLHASAASAQTNTLKAAADARGFSIGAAVNMTPFRNEPAYLNTLQREFNMVVAENVFKMDALRPSQTTYNFGDADALAAFAQANNMKLRGHTLIWHNQMPGWLQNGTFTRDQVLQIMRDHITTVMTRYRGQVAAWDVVNEAIDDSAAMRNSFWFQHLGADYIRHAFEFARQADPAAKLYYNDYSIEDLGAKSNAVFQLVSNLKNSGVPIDGVGWQMHQVNPFRINDNHRANARRLAALGLELSMTEVDIRIALPTSADELQQQALGYRESIAFCVAEPSCKAFVTWGFTDKYSWVPDVFSGQGDALIFNASYQPKPAYTALLEVLAGDPAQTPPAVPAGVAATAGNAQVTLSWSAAARAGSYTVKRASSSAGPFANVATGLTATTFTQTGLANGTTYHYVVSAVNAFGESANSAVASATPAAASLVQVTDFGANPTNLAMHLYVPAGVPAQPGLLLALHWCTGTGPAFYSGTEFASLADRHGFIVIYPSATRSGQCWDVSSAAALRRDGGSDPVGLRSMLSYVQARYNVNPNRIFVTGASSGAMMTNVMLGDYPDVFKAGAAFMGVPFGCFATTDGSSWNSACANGQVSMAPQAWGDLVRAAYPGYSGARPRMMVVHGTTDTVLHYNNFGEQIKQWTNVLGVSQTPAFTDTPQSGWTRTRYGGTGAQSPVEGISNAGVGHNLPLAGQAALAIAFFGLDQPATDPGDTQPPSAPTGLTASGITSSGASLSWTASTDNRGVAGYQVFRQQNSGAATQVGTSTGTSFAATGLSASTAYSFTVRAVDAAGNVSAPSSPVSITTLPGNSGTVPCASAITLASGNSGNFNTTGAACYRTAANIAGWGCYNMAGRTVSVNHTALACGAMPLPPKWTDGYYYFSFTAGQYPWAGFYYW